MALVGTAAAAVLSGGFGPSLLKISVVVRSEGFSALSLVASVVAVLAVVFSRGLETSSGVFFIVLGTTSTFVPCPLHLAPSAFRSFPRIRMTLCWTRRLNHTSGFSLASSAPLSLVKGSCVIIPVSVKLFSGGSLSANRSDLGQRSGKMGRGIIPGGCLGEGSFNLWSIGCLNLSSLVRMVCPLSDSSHDD